MGGGRRRLIPDTVLLRTGPEPGSSRCVALSAGLCVT
jgi:hypothetical protein